MAGAYSISCEAPSGTAVDSVGAYRVPTRASAVESARASGATPIAAYTADVDVEHLSGRHGQDSRGPRAKPAAPSTARLGGAAPGAHRDDVQSCDAGRDGELLCGTGK